jgi:hypothetical protein
MIRFASERKKDGEGNAIPYFETSAKTGINVVAAFLGLV